MTKIGDLQSENAALRSRVFALEARLAQNANGQKLTEKVLEESSDCFRTLFEQMAQGVVYQDATGTITLANPAAERILGLALEELQGRKSADPRWRAVYEDGADFPGDQHPAMVALRTGKPVNGVVMGIYHPQLDEYRWLLVDSVPEFRAEAPQPYQVYTTFTDITERKHTEAALKRNERVLLLLVEHAPAAIAMLDNDMRYMAASRRYLVDYNLGAQDLTGRSHYEVFPEIPERWKAIHRRCLAGAVEKADEDPFPRADGSLDWVHWEIYPWYDAEGKVGGILLFSEVITARKQAEEALRNSEARYRLLAENISETVWLMDMNFKYLYVSPSWKQVSGLPLEERNEIPFDQQLTPDSYQRVKAVMAEAFSPENLHSPNPRLKFTLELESYREDGSVTWRENNFTVVCDASGKPFQIVGSGRDISERKRAEEALRRSDERYRQFINQSFEGISRTEFDQPVDTSLPVEMQIDLIYANAYMAECNQSMAEMYGLAAPDEFVGKRMVDIHHGSDNPINRAAFRHFIENGYRSLNDETVEYDINGRPLWFLSNTVGTIEDGKLIRLWGTSIEITERKAAERALHESEAQYRLLAENMSDTVWLMDMDLKFIYVSPSVTRMRGLTLEELNTIPLDQQMPPDSMNRAMLLFQEALSPENLNRPDLRTVYTIDLEYYRKDGTKFWSENTFTLILDEHGQPINVLGSGRDVTRRKAVEAEKQRLIEALRARTEDLTLLLEAGRALSEMLDPQQIYALIYRYVKAALPCNMLVVSSFDPTAELLICEYLHTEAGPQEVSGFPPIPLEPPGRGTQSQVIRSGKSLLLPDYDRAHKSAQVSYFFDDQAQIVAELPEDSERTRSAIIVPLTVEGYTVGALQIFSNRLNAHTEDHLRFVEALAFRVSAALANARLFAGLEKHVQERTAEIEAIRQRLELATKAANLGVWDWNIKTGQLFWDEQMYAIYRLTRDNFQVTLESFMAVVHPEDLANMLSFAQGAIEGQLDGQTEYRVLRGDNTVGHVKAHGIILRDSTGETEHIIGVVQDITQEKLAEKALRESEEQNRLLFDETPEAISLVDMNGKFIRVNHAYVQLAKIPPAEMLGKTDEELGLVTAEVRADLMAAFIQSLEQKETFMTVEYQLSCGDGQERIVESRLFCLKIGGQDHLLITSRDISVQKEAEETLRRANREMERAMRMKDEFLASMSHELRTPLTGILGLSEALQMRTYGEFNEKQLKALKNIESSGRHLLDLINDILDLSKIEAGKFEMQFEFRSLGEICQASLQLTKGLAHQKLHNVSFSMHPASIVVRADSRRLKQMLVNLLSNAIKFTPENGALGLEVLASEAEQVVKITVWDKGVGIAPEDIQRLFKPFIQLDSSLARQHSGTGLGLSLVQRMAELHGGSVQVESTPGEGSRFTILLPWALPNAEPVARPLRHTGALRSSLTVDDSEIEAEHITRYLRHLGIVNVVHPVGQGAVELAARMSPGVILLDLHLPDISGFDLLAELKTDPRTRHIPVVICSAEKSRTKALALGVAGYLVKPFTLTDLRNELSEVSREQKLPAAVMTIAPHLAIPLVLIADDNEITLQTISDFLEAQNFRVVAVQRGMDLLNAAPEIHPDIVLMDIQMPGMDGLEATRRLRAHSDPLVAQVPIIAITALAMPGDREMCLQAGANEYLSKPLHLQKLVGVIQEMVHRPKL